MTGRHHIVRFAWISVFAIGSWIATNSVMVRTEFSLLLPTGKAISQKLLIDQIHHGSTSRFILLALTGADQDTLTQSSKILARILRKSLSFSSIQNGDLHDFQKDSALLFQNRYLLSSQITAERFQEPALRIALSQRLQDLASLLPAYIKNQTTHDLTGEFLEILRMWSPSHSLNRYNGVWFSPQENAALLTVKTTASGFDLDAQERTQQELRAAVSRIRSMLSDASHLELLMTGPAVFAVESRARIKTEAQWLSTIAGVLVVMFLLINYRSLMLIGFTLVPLASGLLASILVVNWVFEFIHGITLAFGATLIGVAIDYPVHLISHLTAQRSPVDVLRTLWPVIGLGAVTTALGYCAMVFSGFPGLSQLGLFAIIGLLSSALITKCVLPYMISAGTHVSPIRRTSISRIQRIPNLSGTIPVALLLSLGYLLWSPHTFWEEDIANLSPIPQEIKERDTRLREGTGTPAVRNLMVVIEPTEEDVLQQSELLIPMLEEEIRRGAISGYELAAQYLPSVKTQRYRQTLLPPLLRLRTSVERAQAHFPFKQGIFGTFIQDIDSAKQQDPVTRRTLDGTAFGMKLDSLLFQHEHQWVGIIHVYGVTDHDRLRTLIKKAKETQLLYLDLKHEADRMITTYRDEVVKFLSFGTMAIILVLAIRLKSWALMMRIVTTVGVSVISVLAILHLLNEHISLFHLSSLLLVIGIGLDYTLFFHHHHRDSDSRLRTIWAILICSTTTILAFGLLAMSQTPVLHSIGLTVTLGACCCLLFSMISGQITVLKTTSHP